MALPICCRSRCRGTPPSGRARPLAAPASRRTGSISEILTRFDVKVAAAEASRPPKSRAMPRKCCSADQIFPTTSLCGCNASGATTVTAAQRSGATGKRVSGNPLSRWIRVPERRSQALRRSDRQPTVRADGRDEGLPPEEKPVYAFLNIFVRPGGLYQASLDHVLISAHPMDSRLGGIRREGRRPRSSVAGPLIRSAKNNRIDRRIRDPALTLRR